jgi:hypothetical protein
VHSKKVVGYLSHSCDLTALILKAMALAALAGE